MQGGGLKTCMGVNRYYSRRLVWTRPSVQLCEVSYQRINLDCGLAPTSSGSPVWFSFLLGVCSFFFLPIGTLRNRFFLAGSLRNRRSRQGLLGLLRNRLLLVRIWWDSSGTAAGTLLRLENAGALLRLERVDNST